MTTKRNDNTGSAVVKALEAVWTDLRKRHPDLPDVVIITGSGLTGGPSRWGHFWADRWNVEGAAVEPIEGKPERRAEMFVAGERLACGAEATLQTMLHEGAHALAEVRGIQDTSRQGRWHNQRFLDLAREVGLDYPDERASKTIGWSAVVLTDETREHYAPLIKKLDAAIVAHLNMPTLLGLGLGTDGENAPKTKTKTGTPGRQNPRLTCGCDKPRIIRVSRATVEQGPILCGVCKEAFSEDEPEQPASGTEGEGGEPS